MTAETLELEEFVADNQPNPSDSPYEVDAPEMTSEAWNDYVMSHFFADELADGQYPTVDGLRRVVNHLLGPTIKEDLEVLQNPSTNNGLHSVVKAIVVIHWTRPDFRNGLEITFASVADVATFNTPEPYVNHSCATADSKAFGRAFKKALMLRKVLTFEEALHNNPQLSVKVDTSAVPNAVSNMIQSEQIRVLNVMAERLGVNLMKFINAGKNKYNDVSEISKESAVKMIQELNSYQLDKDNPEFKTVPEEIKK